MLFVLFILSSFYKINYTIGMTSIFLLAGLFFEDKSSYYVTNFSFINKCKKLKTGMETNILAINDDEIANGSELNQYLSRNPLTEDEIEILIKRDGEEIIKTVSPSYSGELYVAGFSYNLARTEAKGFSVIKYSFFFYFTL